MKCQSLWDSLFFSGRIFNPEDFLFYACADDQMIIATISLSHKGVGQT